MPSDFQRLIITLLKNSTNPLELQEILKVTNKRIAMNSKTKKNHTDCVSITVRFVSIMQKYSGNKREVEMELPTDPAQAIHLIINHFQIPWKDNLDKSTRIFINQTLNDPFVDSGKRLKDKDTIAFIPLSGGG